MPKTFRLWGVDQSWLLPPSAHELVPPGHLARFVRDTVREALDLRAEDGGPPGRAQRNFTDPDSRIQPTRDGFR